MDRKIGSIIGLVGGLLAVAGFFLPWISFSFNLGPLREALGPLAAAAEGLLAGTVPSSLSISGFNILTGGIQGLLSVGPQVPGAAPADLGQMAGIITLVMAVIVVTLVLAILTLVSSAVNLTKGRLRIGMIGFGAGTLALSLLLFGGLQMLVNAFYGFIQQQAASAAGGLAGSLDLAGTVSKIFSLGVGPGIYLVIVGGVLGVVGGAMGRKREKKEPAPAEAVAATPAAEAPK